MRFSFEIDLQCFNTVQMTCLIDFLDDMCIKTNAHYVFLNTSDEITTAIKNDDCTGLKIEVTYKDEIKPYTIHYIRN